GIDVPGSKLTEEDVRMIRELAEWKSDELKKLYSTCSVQAIADYIGMNKTMVERFLAGTKELPKHAKLIKERSAYRKQRVARLNSIASVKALADKFDVHKRTIDKVLCYASWRHIR
ncbi:MAG: hypothetical protein ACUZ8H_15590, partial [Candidatus Anammoxibacter sp.]